MFACIKGQADLAEVKAETGREMQEVLSQVPKPETTQR